MNFKKVNKNKVKDFDADSVKMVKVTLMFPVWKHASEKDILSEFNDMNTDFTERSIEESPVTVADLEKFKDKIPGDWLFYHRDYEIYLSDIIKNSKKKSGNK
jgi:hypothetical protein